MQLTKQAKQVWNHIVVRLHETKARVQNTDDTVEAQAQTFRIWMWASAAALAFVVIGSVLSHAFGSKEAAPKAPVEEVSVLESLPEGFVIAPIDPTNTDSLDSMFDQHGYADLYRADGPKGKGRRIARGLPLIRAPRNPRRFAVIVSEARSAMLADLNEPVLVILRKGPPKVTDLEEPRPKKRKSKSSPIFQESDAGIDLIEEKIPESAQSGEAGAKS